ncbi:MAG TPA: hypothetical protein VK742_01120 [Candidatus Sulfotelmatobacter sp.]|jgi:hypothetical protein|nr:hypothetical protein [Candidatus Sulfotelmatobacter sp.]
MNQKIRYTVCVPYTTVKGVEMFNRIFDACSQNETHVELFVVSTGERVVFTRKELL